MACEVEQGLENFTPWVKCDQIPVSNSFQGKSGLYTLKLKKGICNEEMVFHEHFKTSAFWLFSERLQTPKVWNKYWCEKRSISIP